MASLADAVPQVNGLAEPSPPSPPSPSSSASQSQPQLQSESAQSANAPTKRKRESSDDGSVALGADADADADADDDEEDKALVNGTHSIRDEAALIRDYLDVLRRYDTTPSILKRPLPEPSAADEPQSKRQKSDHDVKGLCIQDKVDRNSYQLLDQLVLDLQQAIQDRGVEMQSAQSTDGIEFDDDAFIELANLKEKALEIHSREMAYPQTASSAAKSGPGALDGVAQKPAVGNTVLTVFGSAPQPKYLFSSLQKREPAPDRPEGLVRPLPDVQLPGGISTTTVLPTTSSDSASRVPTLGELFPSPANLPPLQPPKAPKTATKSKVLGFYHPELAERSRYRQGSYFTTDLTTGAWLDYSNATPPSKNRSRQRERTLSLAGQKPSTADLEMTEMETLFRGAFSSFAPEKDDSGAIVPSGEVARIWYQRQGHRYMEQLIESELAEDAFEEAIPELDSFPIDEDAIDEVVENWDDSMIDPRLTIDDVLGKKSDEEKQIDDILEEVSDSIETLSSYQRNRNMALPTSQNRNSADPAKADMLNGSLAQEPTDEERDTYEMLKAQLALVIQNLPPYAVARLNSDKLAELNVSTKLEIRSDVYKGVMEEDEASARLKHQQQAAVQAAQTPRQPQRAPSFQGSTSYQQYNRPFPVQNQTPVPIPNHYQQSPMRAQMPPSFQRQASAPMAGMQPQQHRQPSGQPFARPNGYIPQPMQQRPYGTPGAIPPYPASPVQQRIPAGYPGAPPPGTPGQRYPPTFTGYSPQQPAGMQPQYHQQQGGFASHLNGAGAMPPRTMSPQVPQYQPAASYSPRAVPQAVPRPQSYGPPGQPGAHPGIPRFPSNGVQQNPPQSPAPGNGPGGWVNPISPQRQYEQQLQARNQAATRLNAFGEKIQNAHAIGVSGLGGIGIGGAPVDMAKLAQMRANMPGGISQSSPSPRPISSGLPAGANGVPQPSPSPASVPGATPSPAPSANMQSQAPA